MDKLYEVDDFLLGVNGEPGDAMQFTQFIARNLQLYRLRNGYQLDATAVAHFIKNNLLDALKLQRTIGVSDKDRLYQGILPCFLII